MGKKCSLTNGLNLMKLTLRQAEVLMAICRRIQELRLENAARCYESNRVIIAQDGYAHHRELQCREEFRCLIRFSSIFGGRPTSSDSTSFLRAVRQLAAGGMFKRVYLDHDVRATHVKPSDPGWGQFERLTVCKSEQARTV